MIQKPHYRSTRWQDLVAKLEAQFAGLILFSTLMIRFFVQLGQNNPVCTTNEKGIAFVNIIIISVTLIVVTVPEGHVSEISHLLICPCLCLIHCCISRCPYRCDTSSGMCYETNDV